LVYLLPDFSYPVYALWFTCFQTLAILFILFGLLAKKLIKDNMIFLSSNILIAQEKTPIKVLFAKRHYQNIGKPNNLNVFGSK
jgi:hypothetical protein